MILKIFIFTGIFSIYAMVSFIVSFYFGYDPIYSNKVYQLFFILGVCYIPAVVLALIFRNTVFVKDIPYYIVGLATLIFIIIIIPAWVKKQQGYANDWNTRFTTTQRDFPCTSNSYISYSADSHNFLKYSNESGEDHITVVADADMIEKTITPSLDQITLQNFITKYSCKNSAGKTIFDYYEFEPAPDDLSQYIGRQVAERGVAITDKDGASINVFGEGNPVLIANLSAWPAEYEGKKVMVFGLLDSNFVVNNLGKRVTQYGLKNATWKLESN